MPWNLNLGDASWLWPWPGAAKDNQPKTGEKRPRSDDDQRDPKRQNKGPDQEVAKDKFARVRAFYRKPKPSQVAQRDRELTRRARKRWEVDIDPGKKHFTDRYNSFQSLLDSETMTLDKILNTIFSPQERQLLIPANRQLRPRVAEIQKQNQQTYLALLNSRRFKAWTSEHEPDLALKLTLAYFGLPVEPLSADTYYQLRDGVSDDDDEELPALMPAKRNLRFANKYSTQMYGRDAMRKPDRDLERYYHFDELKAGPSYSRFDNLQDNLSPPLGLRGGGDDDDEDEDDDDDEDDLDVLRDSLARRVRFLKNSDMPLYGYQGKVWFQLDSFASIIDAVDRLLGLDNRAGVTYTLRIRDRNKPRDPWEKKTISCKGVGNFSADFTLWGWALKHLAKSSNKMDKILFVSGPSDPEPSHWEPKDEHRVLKLSLEWKQLPEANRQDVAYIRMPEKRIVPNIHFTNQYGPWMEHACRVLAAGRIPHRPGRPAIPDAFITLKDTSTPLGTYGGLGFLPQLWGEMVESWKENAKKTVVLEAISASWLSNRFWIFVPGSSHPSARDFHIAHDTLDGESASVSVASSILSAVHLSLSQDSISKLKEIEVHLPGDEILAGLEGETTLVIPVSAAEVTKKSQHQAAEDVTARLLEWKAWLLGKKAFFPAKNGLQMFPQFISLRPVFTDNTIRDKISGSATRWEPLACTLAEFRATVEELCTGKKSKPGRATSSITIEQTGIGPDGGREPLEEGNPSFVIGSQVDEAGWRHICNFIVVPDVVVSMRKPQDEPIIFGSLVQQPFGYRDIYQTPFKELYKDLKEDEYPAATHYYDWQMWEQNPSGSTKLRTLPPGEDKALPHAIESNPTPGFQEDFEVPKERPQKKSTQVPFAETPSYKPRTDVKVRLVDPKPDFMRDKSLTDLQKSIKMREYSYDHPLNVQMTKAVPVHAPPEDKILRVGGTNTPLVSLAVLTPSETRWHQRAYLNLRNILLNRNQACPFPGCDHVYPTAEPEQLESHLKEAHTATAIRENCPFCDTEFFHQWNRNQRIKHFATDHGDILSPKSPGKVNNPKPTTALEDEEQWKFCARCGRDHSRLNKVLDRKHHDKVCYPGATLVYDLQDRLPEWQVCASCGDRYPAGAKEEHDKAHNPGEHADGPYCEKCGLPLGRYNKPYRDKHCTLCYGYGKEDLDCCPWCGNNLIGSVDQALEHTNECEERPEGAKPVNPPTSGIMWEGEREEGEPRQIGPEEAEFFGITTRPKEGRR